MFQLTASVFPCTCGVPFASRSVDVGGSATLEFKKYTGCDSGFPYRALSTLKEPLAQSYCHSLRQRFKKNAQLPYASEEWLVRTYISVKLILSASVMLSSARYAAAKALRIVEPYLLYYSLLNTSRALVLLVPEQRWDDGKLLDETTHTKVLNVTAVDRFPLASV